MKFKAIKMHVVAKNDCNVRSTECVISVRVRDKITSQLHVMV